VNTRLIKQNSVTSALIGLIVAGLLLVMPFPLTELLGAVILIALPGYYFWRLLGFQSLMHSPFTWAAIFLTSLVVVPLAINVTGMAFGLKPAVIVFDGTTEVARPGTKDQSVMVVGMIRSAVQSGDCAQARAIAQQFAELLTAQTEDVDSVLATCQ